MGKMQERDLGPVGGAIGATSINDAGQIVGAANNRAVLWQNGTMMQLGILLDSSYASVAEGINDSGQVVGEESIFRKTLHITEHLYGRIGVMSAIGTLSPGIR